jgi:TetR/AcrR family transcriptional repressor of mexCD-oprJ operon
MAENGSRRADAERNAQAIVTAAARLLADDPHAAMAAIAEAAGVTRVTVNRHFQTRENLVAAVYERGLQTATEVLESCRLDEGPAGEALTRLLRGWIASGPMLLPVQVVEQGHHGLRPEARAHYYEGVLGPPLHALMQRGSAAGEFADLPPEWMVRFLGATVKAALEAIDTGTLTPDAAADLAARSLLRGLRG